MVIAGKVQNGVVVLEGDVKLPEGQEVKVIAVEPTKKGTHSVLDIPTVDVGPMLVPFDRSEVYDEMLEGRL